MLKGNRVLALSKVFVLQDSSLQPLGPTQGLKGKSVLGSPQCVSLSSEVLDPHVVATLVFVIVCRKLDIHVCALSM